MVQKFVLVVACILIVLSSIASVAVACSRMRVSEAINYVGMMNRMQQQHFLENHFFARTLEDLNKFAGADVPPQTINYKFQVHLKDGGAISYAKYIGKEEPCTTKCELGITSLFGECFDSCCSPLICFSSRKDCVYSVTGIVYLLKRDSQTQSVLCKGSTPKEEQPFLRNGKYVCPS